MDACCQSPVSSLWVPDGPGILFHVSYPSFSLSVHPFLSPHAQIHTAGVYDPPLNTHAKLIKTSKRKQKNIFSMGKIVFFLSRFCTDQAAESRTAL